MKLKAKRILAFFMAVTMLICCEAFFSSAYYDQIKYQPGYRITKEIYKDSDGSTYIINLKHDDNGNLLKCKDESGHITYTYDKNGKPKTLKEGDGDCSCIYSYIYDQKGNLVKKVSKYYNSENFTDLFETITNIYKYDDNNNLIYKKDEDGVIKYKYDDNGNLVKMVTNEDGCKTIDIYKYDEKGTLIKKSQKTEYSSYVCTYKYDANGKLLKEKTKSTDHGEGYIYYKYNSDGLLIKQTTLCDDYGNDTLFYYDKNGNLIKVTEGIAGTYKYTYDESGKLTGYKVNKAQYHYSYDENGNRIKEVCKNDGTVVNTKYKKFKIKEKNIDNEQFVRLTQDSFKYDGKEKTPDIIVTNAYGAPVDLFKGVDYQIKYSNNKKVGTATATIVFKDTYIENTMNPMNPMNPVTLTFKIVK